MLTRIITLLFLCFITANLAFAQSHLTEADYNQLYCDEIGGSTPNQAKRHMRKFNGIPKQHFELFLKKCE